MNLKLITLSLLTLPAKSETNPWDDRLSTSSLWHTKELWSLVFGLFGVSWVMPKTVAHLLTFCKRQLENIMVAKFGRYCVSCGLFVERGTKGILRGVDYLYWNWSSQFCALFDWTLTTSCFSHQICGSFWIFWILDVTFSFLEFFSCIACTRVAPLYFSCTRVEKQTLANYRSQRYLKDAFIVYVLFSFCGREKQGSSPRPNMFLSWFPQFF